MSLTDEARAHFQRTGLGKPFSHTEFPGTAMRTAARKHAREIGAYPVHVFGTGKLIWTRDIAKLTEQERFIANRWPESETLSELRAMIRHVRSKGG